jgi:hypothetical protein
MVPVLFEHMGELVRIKQVAWILSWHGFSWLEGIPWTESSPQSLLIYQAKRRVQ